MCGRGYCSYNNMVHVVNQNQYFLFRTKDIHTKGLVGKFNFPEEEALILTLRSLWLGAILKRGRQIRKATHALLIRWSLLITLNMAALILTNFPFGL